MRRRSGCAWLVCILLATCGSAFGQNSYTNVIPGSTADLWGNALQWTNELGLAGVPGYNVITGAGNSNDDAVVYFGTTASGSPQLNLIGTSYVLRTLFISESTNALVNAEANFISTGLPATLTLEAIDYFQGGRTIDFHAGVGINDKTDGNAFFLRSAASAFDFGGPFTGSEGIRIDSSQSINIRNYQIAYGAGISNGIINEGGAGGTRNFGFVVTNDMVHDIPNFVINNSGNFNTIFQRSSGTNQLTVNINDLTFATNTTRLHLGGESLPDGTPGTTVNVNDQIDFSVADTSSDRIFNFESVYGGIVNFNSNIVLKQSLDAGRAVYFNGNGVVNVNADPIRPTLDDPITMTFVLDGARSLVVGVNDEGRLGQGDIRLRPGTVLQLNYDVFAHSDGFPGTEIRYDTTTNNFFYDFGVAQSGFFSPAAGQIDVPLEVLAFTGIAGNLSNAVYSGVGVNIIFQTNGIIGSGSLNMPTRADLGGAILWEGIRTAGGTYTNIGDDGATSIFRGVALSALTPIGTAADIFSTSGTNMEQETYIGGFHGTLESRPGKELEVLIAGDVTFTAYTNGVGAVLNSDTGVANLRGPGYMGVQVRNGQRPLMGSATNINRIGLDGTDANGENPQRINTQGSTVLDLITDAALSNQTVKVTDGRVIVRGAGSVGGTTGSSNTTLIAGSGGTIWVDNQTSQGNIDLNRGRFIFEDGGAFWTGGGDDRAGATAVVITNMVIDPNSMLIVNDGSAGLAGGYRDMSTALYSHLITNMNIIFSDDAMKTTLVQNAASFAIGDGRRLTVSATEGGNLERIAAQAGGTNNTAILAVRNSSNVYITASQGQTFNIRPDIATTNAVVTSFNDTDRFTTVTGDSTIRSNVAQIGTINLYGRTNLFNDVAILGGTINVTTNNAITVGRNLFVTNGATFNIQGTNAIGVNLGDATFQDVLSYGTTKFEGNTSIVANVQSAGGAVRFFGAYNQVSNLIAMTGGDFEFGNTSNDVSRIYGDIRLLDATNDSSSISFSQGDVRVQGNIYSEAVVNTNALTGGPGLAPTVNLNAHTNIITGSVYIGPTNGPDGGSVSLNVGNNDSDNTVIGGDLVLNTAHSRGNGASLIRGDVVVSNNIIVNATRVNYLNNTNDFIKSVSGNSTLFWVQANNDTNFGDGIGLWDRLADGTLAMGPDGIVVRDFGQLLIDVSRTNKFADGWVVGQRVTIDNLGPNYIADGSRNLWLRAQTNSINGGVGAGTPIVALTNVWMLDGSHLRVLADRVDPRLGIFIDGTSNGATAYLSGRAASTYSNINLLDIQSSSSGVARTLQIGTTNGPLEFPLLSFLYGTASSDVTLNVFNGRLIMTNGAAILGTAQVSRDGSVFEVATGTTGFVNEVNMLAGTFSNRGDLMAFNDVTVSGGQAFMGNATSYATNLNLYGGTAIVESVSLGQVTFDGGALRADADRVLAADQGIRVTNIANGGLGVVIVDSGVTMAIANAIDGDGTLAKDGLGTLILSNANQHAGTTVRGGTLLYSADNRLRTDAGGTITMEGGVLDLNTFNQDSTGTVTFAGGLVTNGTITKAGADFDAQAGEVAATLQGTAGLTKTGTGTMILSGSNAYQGATVIAEGSLRIDNANALPGGIGATGGTSTLVLTNGGVLGIGIGETFARDLGTGTEDVQWTGSGGFAAYGADRYVNIGGATQTLVWGQANFVSGENELVFGAADSTHTLIFENNIEMDGTNRFRANNGFADVDGRITGNLSDKSGSVGTLWKTGDGVLELTGSNTYSGGTEVLGGQLLLSGSNALSENSLLVISNYGVITLGATDFVRDLGTNGGDVVWTGSGGFAASGADRTVNIGGSTQQLVWGSAWFVPEGVNDSTLVLSRTGTTHTVDFQNDIDLGASNRTVWAGNGDAAIDAVLSGVLSGSGGLIKVAPGTLLLNNTNLFTGGLEVQNGRLVLDGGDNRLQSMAVVLGSTNGDSGVLQLGGAGGKSDQTFSGLTMADAGTGNAVVGGASQISTLTLDIGSNITNIYAGMLGGAGLNENNLALVKSGDGILVLTSANTYTGITTVSDGILAVDAAHRLGGDPGSLITNQLTLDGGIFAAIGTFGMDANRGITLGSAGGTIWVDATRFLTNNGGIYGGGNLTKAGDGVLILKTDSEYAGDTFVAGGVLRLDATNALPGGTLAAGGLSALTLTDGGVIGLGATNFLRGLGTGDSQVQWAGDGGFAAYNQNRIVNLGGAAVQLTWGSGGFVPDGNALILATADSTNTVTFVNPISLGTGMTTNQQREFRIGNAGSVTEDAILAGVISGSISNDFLKTGAGRVFLAANNSFTGRLLITQGTVSITNETGLNKLTAASGFREDALTLDGGTLALAGAANFTITNAQRGIYLGPNGGIIDVASSRTHTITNTRISGDGNLTKAGSGALQMYNASNTYSGRTILTGGALAIDSEQDLGLEPGSFVSNQLQMAGGTLRTLGGNNSTLLLDDPNRGIQLTADSSFDVNAISKTMIISNQITGATGQDLIKIGAGLMMLGGSNDYLGATVVRQGTLAVGEEQNLGGNPATFAAAQLLISNGATFRALDSFTIDDSRRGVTLGFGGGLISVDADETLIISNTVAGIGSLTKVGNGTLILAAATNSYSGSLTRSTGVTTIAGGTLAINNELKLGLLTNAGVAMVDNALMISNGGTFRALASFTIDDGFRGIQIGQGGGGIEVDSGFTLTISNSIFGNGSLTKAGNGQFNLYGYSNVFANVYITNGNVYFGNEATDRTVINGNLVIDVTTNANPLSYQRVQQGDFSVTNDIIVNASGLKQRSTYGALFKVDGQAADYGTAGDGLGLMERLINGTLAQGPNGVVVNDYARFEIGALRTNVPYTIGQKITVATTGPNYSNNERTLDFRGETGTGTTLFFVTNVHMADGSYLRVNEFNSDVRLGLTLQGTGYLSDSTSGENEPFDLLDVRSSSPGSARTLQIGTVNGIADIPFVSTLFGTGSADVTFNIYNGRLMMTNGAEILGAVQIDSNLGRFDILPGTTGYVNEVAMSAGIFSNRGDLVAFSNINVAGGNAFLDGIQSYVTNLSLGGGTATVASADLGLGKLTFDGGTFRAATNYVLDAASGTTLGGGGGTFLVDPGTTLTSSNVIDGIGGLAKTGDGTMIMANANTYGGSTLIGGGRMILASGANDRLPTNTFLTMGGGVDSGVLQLGDAAGSSDQTLAGLTTSGGGTDNRVVGGNASISRLTLDIAGGVTNTYGGALGGPGANENALALTKAGAGILVLEGTNTYLGQTSVGAGTLLINGDNSAASGIVSVLANAVLGGDGIIGGQTIFQSNAMNAPGFLAPGIETFANGVTYSNASVFQWELVANSVGSRGTGFDGVDVTGNELNVVSGSIMSLVFNGQGSAVDWSDAFWDVGQQWLVFDLLGSATTNSTSSAFAIDSSYLDSLSMDLATMRPGAVFFTSYAPDGDLYLNYAIPEPSTWALLCAGLGLCTLLSRRRRP